MLNEIIKRIHSLTVEQQKDVLHFLKLFSQNEERLYPRKKMSLNIDAVAGDKLVQTDIENISASGVYINAAGRFKLGEKARVVFQVPGQSMPFKINGELVRVESNGVAIQFKDLNPYIRKILDDAIWDTRN